MSRDRPIRPEDDWRISPLSLLIAGFIRGLAATVQFRVHDDTEIRELEASGSPFILAFWHRYLVLMRFAYHGRRIYGLVSQSWDGELTARTFDRLGIDAVRGSSSRGGALGLRDALKKAREGSDLAFTPDGPRGPLRVVQPGVVLAASLSGHPVVPVAMAASRSKVLRSWDQMLIPLPGSRVETVFSPTVRISRQEPVEVGIERLTAALLAAEAKAEALVASAR